MSQLYQLKDGSIGHSDDVEIEGYVERLGKMKRSNLAKYVQELMQVPIPYEGFKRYMRQAFKIIESKESTSESLQTALTTVAEMEQTGLHDDELEERIEKIMAKYGRIPKSELQENIRIRKEFKEELERNAKDPNYDPYRDYKKRSTMGWLAF